MRNKLHEHEEAAAGFSVYPESYIRLASARSIFFSENVTKTSAAQLSAMLIYYDHLDDQAPISLYLNSNGGDATGLANIYDVMHMINAPVHTILLGKCYSAGAIILAAGAPGNRYALPSSKVMIHGVQFGFPIPGHDITSSKNYLQFINDNNNSIMKMLAKHTGKSIKTIMEDCKEDIWMDAKAALKYGIIDKIIG